MGVFCRFYDKIIELHHAFYLQIPTCYSHDIIFFLLHPPTFSTLPLACFCNRHPFNLLLHRFLCIFIEIMSRCLMVCRSVSRVCFFCSLMFRFTACISSMDVIDSCQPLFTIIFLDLLLVLKVSDCFSYNGMSFRLQLPFWIFLCGYRKLFSINRTVYNNICLSCGLTHKIRISLRTSGADQLADNRKISH